MPSPDEKVTIRDIEKHTGIRHRIVASWATSGYLKSRGLMRVGSVGRFRRGDGSTRFHKGRLLRWFYWRDVEAIVKDYRPGGSHAEDIEKLIPPGYMRCFEAASLLGVQDRYVVKMVKDKKLRGVLVPWNGVRSDKHYVFAERAHVEELAAQRGSYRKLGQSVPIQAKAEKPLISADHEECLEARLALWRANGRRIPRKYRICVDRKKRAG